MASNTKSSVPYGQLGIIALESCKELGDKIDFYLQEKLGCREEQNSKKSFLIPIDEIRFSNGEGKVKLLETARGKDVYILCDVGNYSCSYEMYGYKNLKGPDEHFQDIKRVVAAIGGRARRVTVIMPLLYAARQHRRKSRESLDCAIALQELERLGVQHIMTFDVHDPNVQNAIPLISFENIYPTNEILKSLVKNEKELLIDKSKMIVISPDTGAMDRAIYYSSMLGLDIGLFYKRRDHSKIVAGKNPIIQHEYIGKDVEGMDVLVVDDMISSGESVFDIARELKKRNAGRIYVSTTFALFTEGIQKFENAHAEGLIEKVYSTNLTYIPEKLKDTEWFEKVDMSEFISDVINHLNCDKSIRTLINASDGIKQFLNKTV